MTVIKTSLWINIKSMRFYVLQYVLVVFAIPLSYFFIHLQAAGKSTEMITYLVGLFVSMLMSLFISIEAELIANSNSVTLLEQYATYGISPLYVHIGQSVFNALLSTPFFVIVLVCAILSGIHIHFFLLFVSYVLAILMLSGMAMVLGGLLRNPNAASPLISMIYVVAVIITPLYSKIDEFSGIIRTLEILNPFMHVLSLFRAAFGEMGMCSIVISVGVISFYSLIFVYAAYKRWYRCTAAEKLTLL